MAKTITFTLDPGSIRAAVREMQKVADDIEAKCEALRKRIAEEICFSAQQGFSTAMVTHLIKNEGGFKPVNDVKVSVEHGDHVSIVIADGNEAVFIEYGAGVWHNGAPGDSPHPWGIQQGYGIGTYGKGKGTRNAWNIKKGVVTRGTPAAMPMYRGAEEAIRIIGDLVREVFG